MRGATMLVALLACGCALASATPPRIEVATVELRGVDLLDQSLRVGLCVFNPNDQELAFRGIEVGIDLAGAPLAIAGSESSVVLPSHQSVLVHFEVVTTVRSLGSQLLATLTTGAIDYRLHGSVQLAGSLGFTVPFSRRGRLDLVTAGQALLSDQAAGAGVACDSTT